MRTTHWCIRAARCSDQLLTWSSPGSCRAGLKSILPPRTGWRSYSRTEGSTWASLVKLCRRTAPVELSKKKKKKMHRSFRKRKYPRPLEPDVSLFSLVGPGCGKQGRELQSDTNSLCREICLCLLARRFTWSITYILQCNISEFKREREREKESIIPISHCLTVANKYRVTKPAFLLCASKRKKQTLQLSC